MAGRERVPVAANETLERVLDRLRSSQAEEIVLDVDERSPLLLSVPNLDSLDETAQRQGIRLTVASTSSRVLNAARVFGLPVIDTTAAPSLARSRPDPNARLLAGEPLGGGDASVGGVAIADEPAPEPVKPGRPAPVIAFRTVTVGEEIESADDDETDGWEEADDAPPPPRNRPHRATAPAAARTGRPRLDPYGQPYPEAEDEADDDLPAPRDRRRANGVRPTRQSTVAAPPAAPERDEEGWDDGLIADDGDDEPSREEPRPGLLGGMRAFWADVRERVAARRQPLVEDVADDDDEEDTPEASTDGWDEPPYQQRVARAATPIAPAKQDEEPLDDTGELPPPVIARPARTIRSLRDPTDSHRQPTARLYPVAGADDEADDEEEWYEDRVVARRGVSNGLVWALLALLAVGLVGVLVAYVLVPRAVVTLVARTSTPEIGFDVVVGEIDPNSPEGQPTNERIVVPAQRIVVPVNASATKPATGSRLEPDVTAGGPVVFTNASVEALGVPKGTVLTATDGRTFVTLDAVTVPPADPFNSGSLGAVTVKVAAQTRGSGGNAAIGVVRGQIGSALFYNNRDAPIAGGSDRRIPTIAKADLAAAQAAAEEAARGKWQAAITAAIPAGSKAMHDTAGLGPFRVEFSAKEGADGDSVSATVVADATVLVYNPGEVEARARAEAERRINAAARPGEPLVAGSIQIGTPQLVGDVPGTLTYRMTATARSRAAIGSDAEREQLANDLAHQSDDEANAILARLPGVSSATIAYDTGPFPRRMPWLASHIEIVIAER